MALISIEPWHVWLERLVDLEFERESDEYVVRCDPSKWKDQDHYMILGLQKLRYLATEDDIRRAHRRKALKHHPDKRGKVEVDLDSDYYGCITRAMDILNDQFKRQSFDSVDPTFDDDIPSQISATKIEKNPQLFFRTFTKTFLLNSRWSIKQPVPQLGNENSPREHVEKFYDFWYNFQSWRQFSYLDEEDKETGENREERRWLDKQNKAARQVRKKEENQRIRQLVDNAYYCDPRIVKFKEQDKRQKLELKKAKQEAIRQKIEREEAERSRLEQEEKIKKEKQEQEEKEKKMAEKKAKEIIKKNMKKAIKSFEDLAKMNNYFILDENEKLTHLEELDKLCRLSTTEQLIEMRQQLSNKSLTSENKREIFLSFVSALNQRIEYETSSTIVNNLQHPLKSQQQQNGNSKITNGDSNGSSNGTNTNGTSHPRSPNKTTSKATGKSDWSKDEVSLLIKAVSTFPAGTKDRWDVVAKYLQTHSPNHIERDSKQVLTKVKELQQTLVRNMKH